MRRETFRSEVDVTGALQQFKKAEVPVRSDESAWRESVHRGPAFIQFCKRQLQVYAVCQLLLQPQD